MHTHTSDEEAYFLLWAGDFSPASPSSSAWTCRSWSPQRYQACQTWLVEDLGNGNASQVKFRS